jgi:predicted HicB family RNase H-like nuclease
VTPFRSSDDTAATMANLNIEIPDELHKRLKLSALLRDATLKKHVIAILEASLDEKPSAKRRGAG